MFALATLKEKTLAKPNYSFEKRQRELAKKKKQEQKLEQKRLLRQPKTDGSEAVDPATGEPPAPAETGTAP